MEGPSSAVSSTGQGGVEQIMSTPQGTNTVARVGSTLPPLPPMNPIAGCAVVPGSSKKKEAVYSLKVTKAEVISGAEPGRSTKQFNPVCHMYLQVTEVSANVTLIKAAIQRKWGSNYTLVTSDGIELEDSPGTEGK